MVSLNQFSTPLIDALKKYSNSSITPFDVPGHKFGKGTKELRDLFGSNLMKMDVNSMKCLDNLSNPTSVIKKSQELLANAYGCDHSFFLVNGTSSGIQGMIMSVCGPYDKIIMPRNVHKSAVSGLVLSGAIPVYIQPETNEDLGIAMGMSYESVKKAILSNLDAKAVFIINPTYYGVTCDLKRIVDLAHEHNMLVLVDEAHGAHFHFHDDLPISAMAAGADMSAISLHKTGGSLTQSSAILLNEKNISPMKIRNILNVTQTTSASYLLMSSLDGSRKILATRGEEIFSHILSVCRYAREKINKIPHLYAFSKELINNRGVYDFDETKLSIKVSDLGLTGFEVYELLRDKYKIQVELGDINNILAIISLGDDKNSVDKLINSLSHISKNYKRAKSFNYNILLENPDIIVSPRDAFYSRTKIIPLKDSIGEVSGESIMAYPPGIPIISPGERISKEIVDYIEELKNQHVLITDSHDPEINNIKILGA
ncbi:MAG: aminotransferase class I/II-fold pyridoxal phosphate-dependent enzyme [Anaeromicrobium sp.]|nr:aminotransferase class I/II-fold pyridoxal phosphate-dependent enzyme [Anaeromicrobium sp.]MCT4593811.1 aminotransferase class I/II-fold pyridoxal phosphate-dependent enzyme [Anaeromicrobium sp.]